MVVGSKTIDMWRWWLQYNNRNVLEVVTEKQKIYGGGGGGM